MESHYYGYCFERGSLTMFLIMYILSMAFCFLSIMLYIFHP